MKPLWQNIFRSNDDDQSLSAFLTRCPAFDKLERRDVKILEKFIHIRNYHDEEMIFNEGDIGSGMYLIRTGQVEVYCLDERDRKSDLTVLEEGDFFGEIALTGSRPRSASARATKPTVLAGLFRSDIDEVIERYPATAARILFGINRVTCDRLLQTNIELQKLGRQLEVLKEQFSHE